MKIEGKANSGRRIELWSLRPRLFLVLNRVGDKVALAAGSGMHVKAETPSCSSPVS